MAASKRLQALRSPVPSSHNLASPAPPRVNFPHRRASTSSSSVKSRPAIPLELPDKSPAPMRPELSSSPKKAKKRLHNPTEFTPTEINAGADPTRLVDTLVLADKKAKAIEAWRAAGAAVQSAAQRQFTAMKLARLNDTQQKSRKRKVAESAIRIAPVSIPFAKELFSLSVDTFIPKLNTSADDSNKAMPVVIRTTPIASPAPPPRRHVDEARPGFSEFAEGRRLDFADREDDLAAGEEELGNDTDSAASPKRAKNSDTRSKDDELGELWDSLDEAERDRFRKLEEEGAKRHERDVAAHEAAVNAPRTSYHIKLRQPEVAKKLLMLPAEWRAFEFVSFAGHRVQNAVVSQVSVDYHVPSEKLTLRCKVGLCSTEQGPLASKSN